jgi:hypothetical protein
VLSAIGFVCLGGLGGPAPAAPSAGDCVGPGCGEGIACARTSDPGLPTFTRPSNVPVAVTAAAEGMRAPGQTWVSAESPPSPELAGPSLSRGGPRSPPTV